MKKLRTTFFVLLVIIISCVFITKSLDEYVESTDISNKLGIKSAGGELSYKEFIILSQRTIGVYYNYLKSNEYEKAYNLFSSTYKTYESSGDYIARVSKEKVENFSVNDIVQKTEYMYEAYLTINGTSNESMMIFLNEDKFALAPGEFIKYEEFDLKEEVSKIEVELLSSKVEVFNCELKMKIKNSQKESCEISKISITTRDGSKITSKTTSFIVEPGEEVIANAVFDTEIDFPKILDMEINVNGKIKNIEFEF